MKRKPTIEFGREYRDHISGFVGICTGKSSFISGCDQVLLVPKVGADGDFVVDVKAEQRVERTSRKGGPQHTPARSS